jgi:transposase
LKLAPTEEKLLARIQGRSREMVIETSRPIAQVAKELGINEGTLGNWVAVYRREHAGENPPLSVTDHARLRDAERENRELKMENDFLKKAACSPSRPCGRPPTRDTSVIGMPWARAAGSRGKKPARFGQAGHEKGPPHHSPAERPDSPRQR